MNIMEETPGTFRLEITGLSMRQIKEIFEDKWGALMWHNGGAHPADDVSLQFKQRHACAAESCVRGLRNVIAEDTATPRGAA